MLWCVTGHSDVALTRPAGAGCAASHIAPAMPNERATLAILPSSGLPCAVSRASMRVLDPVNLRGQRWQRFGLMLPKH